MKEDGCGSGCADINVIADHRRALALTARQVVRADRHLLKNGDVPANLRFIRNKNTLPSMRQAWLACKGAGQTDKAAPTQKVMAVYKPK